MNPWHYVLKDELQIPGNKDQKFSRVLHTWYESLHISYAPVDWQEMQVCLRIFCDNLENLFMSATAINSKGKEIGHACRIPVKMTSHGDYLKSGQYVNVTDRRISEANIRRLKIPLLNKIEEDQMTSLYNGRWWEAVS